MIFEITPELEARSRVLAKSWAPPAGVLTTTKFPLATILKTNSSAGLENLERFSLLSLINW
jgi:hypothetical protein